jgi:hypothetical protein
MNKPSPMNNEWETYCDEWYYHMWRVRRKNKRGFDDGFHLPNGEGARQLVELLNKQDEALASVTEQRDRLVEALEQILNYQGRFAEEDPESIATEALQSLTNQPTQ